MTSHASPEPSQPATPRLAATVLMLRPKAFNKFDVYVQHRRNTMDFAPGMVVFPGGRVDSDDYTVETTDYSDKLLSWHAESWDCTSIGSADEIEGQRMAAVMITAAMREIWEETGVVLDPDQLIPWDNWVTPPSLPKRFDTFFYVAILREAQEPEHQTTEAFSSYWADPEELFASLDRGEIKMMRPTRRTLLDAMDYDTLYDIVESERAIIPVHPDVTLVDQSTEISRDELKPYQL